MSCMCPKQLSALSAQMRNMPLAALAQVLNHAASPLNAVAKLAPQVCARISAAAHASASAAATASASASMNASLSASAMARLEALAGLHRDLILGGLSPTATARLSAMIASSNQQLPGVLNALNAALQPMAAAIEKLQVAMSALMNIKAMTGVDLALPGAAFQLPSVTAAASAQANAVATAAANATATASASLRASANAALSANTMLAMRVQAAAMALGFPLPLGSASLNASLRLAAGLPPVALPAATLAQVAAKVSGLAQTAAALGLNLLSPGAPAALQQKLMMAQANLTAMISGTATANARVQASASAALNLAAQAAASMNASAVLSAAGQLNLGVIPNLSPMATTLSLAADLKALSTGASMFANSPCATCGLKF
ncbi:MAG: hypothetical protein IT423_20665 [Pirellulaceae bacterium]|nr:hypothetical protein [Pirellulaceae bacterium]